MIEAQDLSRRYGAFTAVDGVTFSIDEGEIVGILGPNGAGKTTTLRMITGFLPPSRGRVRVGGVDLHAEPAKARRRIGYLPENVALYGEMRVREYLAYRADLEGLGRAAARSSIGEALERCLLDGVADQIVGTLSKGYRQRVGLATAILHRPDVLVLDEPTVGLDPKQIIAIRELIRELGESRTLLLSTHILPEVELLCRRVLIIDRGRLVDQGTPGELAGRWREDSGLTVELKGAPAEAGEHLAALPGARAAEAVTERPGTWRLASEAGTDLREAVFRLAVERGWVLLTLKEEAASLEDLFVRLTTREPRDAGTPSDEVGADSSEALYEADEVGADPYESGADSKALYESGAPSDRPPDEVGADPYESGAESKESGE